MKAKIKEMELEYQDFGGGPAVLFISDCPSGRDVPNDLLKNLGAAGYRVVLIRRSDLGTKSAKSLEADPTQEAIALLNYLGIGRAVVIGIGLGGYVLFDLLEKFPERVAASTLVIDSATAKGIRRVAKRGKVKAALQTGRLDEFKKTLLAALPAGVENHLSCTGIGQLRAWVETACRRSLEVSADRKSHAALLAEMELPPLVVVDDGASPLSFTDGLKPLRNRSIASRGWSRIKGINTQLLALLNFLVPGEEDADEEKVLTGPG